MQNDAKHPFVVNDDGSVSFWISFNAAKHKGDAPDMQYRKLTLKASDTLSYSTVEVVPQDGSAEFSLTDANGNVKPTLTIYNHEPYTVQAKVTDTTNKMCDFLTTSSNVPGLSSDHWDYQKTHRGMSVDSSHPYVLTLNGQGVDRNGNGTYTFKFESWDGNNIQTFSMPITVVVAPQAGRYRNKVNGRFVTVEVNDPHANLMPESFVDDSTKALLSKAPSGDPHKKGVTYSWGVASGSHATPSKPSIDKLTNKEKALNLYMYVQRLAMAHLLILREICASMTKQSLSLHLRKSLKPQMEKSMLNPFAQMLMVAITWMYMPMRSLQFA